MALTTANSRALASARLPGDLIWFKWEAYLTWVTGFLLLIVQYYLNASTYLISQDVLVLTSWQAIGITVENIEILHAHSSNT